jgi:hypothetical protein
MVPTLDEFRALQPEDYYSESELIDLYHGEFGHLDARSLSRRRQRLRGRLVGALKWLEDIRARAPQPSDGVAAWLDPRIARRLAVVGIRRIGDLMSHIRSKGYHWYRGVPKIGPEGAARIARWVREHEPSLGALPCPCTA